MSNNDCGDRKWLREASMRRLSQFVKNKTEIIGSASQLGVGVLFPEQIHPSGLSPNEIFHLKEWIKGTETGRQCMLAIMDTRLMNGKGGSIVSDDMQTICKEDFKPVELMRTLIQLPNDFLCDTGYIYETVFQRPPTSVIKEALQTLLTRAYEKLPSQLDIEQINLAIKQLKLENLGLRHGSAVEVEEPTENNEEGQDSPSMGKDQLTTRKRGTQQEETFRLQIFIELIRLHIAAVNKERFSEEADLYPEHWNDAFEDKPADGDSSDASKLKLHTIEDYLVVPLKAVLEKAEITNPDELEQSNNLWKPYLKQLSSLKANLSAELKDLQDSRAFLALGLSADATDEEIKKAYRTLAIRLHPDKPGGDTVRFQQLQDSYQEIMKKRKSDSVERSTREDVRSGKPAPKPPSPPKKKNASQNKGKKDNQQGTECGDDEAPSASYEGCEEEKSCDRADGTEGSETMPQDEASDESSEEETTEADSGNNSKKTKKRVVENNDEDNTEDVEADEEEEDDRTPKPNKAQRSASTDSTDSVEETARLEAEAEEEEAAAAEMEELLRGIHSASTAEEMDAVFRKLNNKGKKQSEESAAMGARPSLKGMNSSIIYENDDEYAKALLKQINENMERIRTAAGTCTQLAQKNIKWQKVLEKTMDGGTFNDMGIFEPNSLKDVYKVITASTGNKCITKATAPGKSKKSKKIPTTSAEDAAGVEAIANIDACALQQAIVPVELVCEWCQQVCALAMEFTTNCGDRYAAATAGNRPFLQPIEKCMQLSLGTLKAVLTLINTQDQLQVCVKRVKDSIKALSRPDYADVSEQNAEIEELLKEMLHTGVKSNVITISNTVDKLVETALAASDVKDAVVQLFKDMAAMERAEVKRRAAEAESARQEEDYCEEDREALRKCREDRMEEDMRARKAQQDAAAQKDKEARKNGTKPPEGSLEDLKDKIKSLQVQLKVQHIQALQNMNAEVVQLQQQILKELQALPFVTSVESLLTQNSVKLQPKPKAVNNTEEGKRDMKSSLLSLLADLLDSACCALRNDLVDPAKLSSSTSSSEDNSSTTRHQDLLESHFGWMRIVLADGSAFCKTQLDQVGKILFNHFNTARKEGLTDSSNAASTADAASASATPHTVRLALLPDYRSKMLFLTSLVDSATVHDMVGPQLMQRLDEILLEGQATLQSQLSTEKKRKEQALEVARVEAESQLEQQQELEQIQRSAPAAAIAASPSDFHDIDCDEYVPAEPDNVAEDDTDLPDHAMETTTTVPQAQQQEVADEMDGCHGSRPDSPCLESAEASFASNHSNQRSTFSPSPSCSPTTTTSTNSDNHDAEEQGDDDDEDCQDEMPDDFQCSQQQEMWGAKVTPTASTSSAREVEDGEEDLVLDDLEEDKERAI